MGKVLQVASLALGLMAAGFSAQASAETKIAVINVPRIMQEIPQGKAVEAKLKSEFSSRISEMQRLETEGQNLAAKLKKDEAFMAADERTKLQRRLAELQADFNLKGQALQEDQRRRFNEEQKKVLNKVQDAIDSIAKAQGYDLVLNGQSVVFGAEKLDISAQVIQQVSKSK
ncbi:OmpH family outer membrane protein [Pseudaeromonas pectinilytica]|nr:OmpH family outer membrane protein [Aeromonadaceae bacterium]MBP8772269.1 OmpH family outer membrane protein [Aeromonadaceae bacterium]